jgi:hypothetical protein
MYAITPLQEKIQPGVLIGKETRGQLVEKMCPAGRVVWYVY